MSKFVYSVVVTEHQTLELVLQDGDETILKVCGTSYSAHFRGPEIAALHRGLHKCEMAAAELEGTAKRMEAGCAFDKELVPEAENALDQPAHRFPTAAQFKNFGQVMLGPTEWKAIAREYFNDSEMTALRERLTREEAEKRIPNVPEPLHLTPQEVDIIRLHRMAAEAREEIEELSDADLGGATVGE